MMSAVPAISALQLDYSSSVADATHTPAKSAQLGKIVLTVTKRNPEQFTLPGFYRLLPQLVGGRRRPPIVLMRSGGSRFTPAQGPEVGDGR